MTENTPSPSIAPSAHVLKTIGVDYLGPEAKKLCKIVNKETLSDDEIIVLALAATQAALLKHVEPGDRDAEETLDTILSIVDHRQVVQALYDKVDELLEHTSQPKEAPAVTGL